MRLPHHLVRTSSGLLHFRLRVPIALQGALGRRVIKRSLGTRDLRGAQFAAYTLAGRYLALFEQARRQLGMDEGSTPTRLLPEDDPASPLFMPPYRVERTQHGYALETDGTDGDHEKGLEALRAMMAAPLPAGPEAATVAPERPQKRVGISLGEAVQKYLLTLDASLLPDKTRSQKRAAVNGFAKWKGLKSSLAAEASRTDVSEWVQTLRVAQLATPTISNKCSYLKAFFAWAQNAGHFPPGDNPAAGQVVYGTREKRLRRKLGFEPFSPDQLRVIYAPDNLAKLKPAIRWGALMGLYTGARVSEIGQLALDDFFEEDGVPCFRITAAGEGQSLKTDASERAVPIHPELVALGLLEHVQALKEAGKSRLFPRAKVGSVNGAGNFLSAAFGRYIAGLGVISKVGKVGFHSLRKTAIQSMQTGGVSSEIRAQFVGHELSDEHHATYSRRYTMEELAAVVHPALNTKIFIGQTMVGI